MFMRYRGGGIGHTYMRAIEKVYENMSRERIHHEERNRRGTQPEASMDTNNTDGADGEDEPTGPSCAGRDVQPHEQDAVDDDYDEDDDDDYAPDSDEWSSCSGSDSDDLDSDGNGGGDEYYGLGDL
jgi:hypothetical protein